MKIIDNIKNAKNNEERDSFYEELNQKINSCSQELNATIDELSVKGMPAEMLIERLLFCVGQMAVEHELCNDAVNSMLDASLVHARLEKVFEGRDESQRGMTSRCLVAWRLILNQCDGNYVHAKQRFKEDFYEIFPEMRDKEDFTNKDIKNFLGFSIDLNHTYDEMFN